jgi:cell division GTPase FtsZ
MSLKSSFREMNLGAIYTSLAPFAKSTEVEGKLSSILNLNIVTLGQGGGRKGAELARFGFDIWMVNSATVDMDEHHWIDQKIVLQDPDRGKIEGTAKNAAVGHDIAQKNVQAFKEIAVATQEADLVVVTVALGGGQGNGAIPTALEWISKVRKMVDSRPDHPQIMVIASIPSRDESNPEIWKNALSGLKVLQNMISEKLIGAVIPVDNELIRNYYERQTPLQHNGKIFSALDYSNITVAKTLFEILTIPLLGGLMSLDSAELLEILSTPGWLTLNRRSLDSTDNLESDIQELFRNSEILAKLDVQKTLAAGIALVTNGTKSVPPSLVDSIKPTTNKVLGKPPVLHSAVIQSNYHGTQSFLIGLASTSALPDALLDSLLAKYEEEEERKRQREEEARRQNSKLSGFADVFASKNQVAATSQKRKVSLDELDGNTQSAPKPKVSLDDLLDQ